MKRKAFTLVELMVVLAILALLVVMIMPSMSTVSSLARATLCRNNLEKLGQAFGAAKSQDAAASSANSALSGMYPPGMIWPAVPRNAVDDATLYHCPEDPNKGRPDVGNMFKQLEYENEMGKFALTTLAGASGFYKSRSGQDPVMGGYTDYLLQDDYGNGQFELMNFNGWIDSDGVIRVWHNGSVFVYDSIPNTPEWACTDTSHGGGPGRPNGCNTCGNLNVIFWQGKPAWGGTGAVQGGNRGKTFKLPGWDPGFTNYGISSEAHRYPFGSRAIVLVDYTELYVDLDFPKDAETKLSDIKSARHLGRVNILFGDGTVGTRTPLAISPRLNPQAWEPQ